MSHRFFRRDSKTDKSINNNNNNNKKDFTENKAQLTPLEYRVTQERQTERPFSNRYNRHWEPGTYHCVVCHAELFKSNTKFESKSGWPAFSNVVDPKRVKLSADLSHIGANLLLLIAKPDLARTEVSCANCNAHLGHLFKDGPKPTGLRYCINSSSLNFIPTSQGNSTFLDNTLDDTDSTTGEREFPCNPDNSCEYQPPSARTNSTPSSGQKSQTLPPMATLCLNNQSCQRITNKPPSAPPLKTFRTELSHSIDAIDTTTKRIPTATTNLNSTYSNSNSNGDPRSTSNPIAAKTTGPDNNNTRSNSQEKDLKDTQDGPSFTRTGSSRYPSSKGASLTAARINFFQNLTGPSPPNLDNVGKIGISSANPKPRPFGFTNRFVNSISSGSLGLRNGQNRNDNDDSESHPESKSNGTSRRNSNSNGFSESVNGEKISSAPTPLRETSL